MMLRVSQGLALLLAATLLAAGLTGCSGEDNRIDDLSDASFELVDHNGDTVVFPDDFAGQAMMVGYVYTQCPDICPLVTVNMKQVHDKLDAPDDVAFVTITFDPQRDTPERLRDYRDAYGLDNTDWSFLTGDRDTILALMDRVGVRVELSRGTYDDDDYLIDHTDQISLIDEEGRVLFHYGGSMTPVEIFAEDLETIRPAS
ncbi:MAG: SCO family protein [Longimonas sp.]|uniref:SCO family protein n=1 Tax=Longimonas sp. TaxID=2039626 RepID=UPI003355952B